MAALASAFEHLEDDDGSDDATLETTDDDANVVALNVVGLTATQNLRPICKYPGGKSSLLPQIAPYMPNALRYYAEPFLGSGAVLMHILAQLESGAMRLEPGACLYANDINGALIACFRELQADAARFVAELTEMAAQYNALDTAGRRAMHLRLRNEYNANRRRVSVDRAQACRFLMLVQTSFRGLWRENHKGDCNAPVGESKSFHVRVGELLAVGNALARYPVRFSSLSAEQFMRNVVPLGEMGSQDLVFFDSPYACFKSGGFTSYSGRPWKDTDFMWLRKTSRALRGRGVLTFVCNNRTRSVTITYEECTEQPWQVVVALAMKGGMQAGRAEREEVVYCSRRLG